MHGCLQLSFPHVLTARLRDALCTVCHKGAESRGRQFLGPTVAALAVTTAGHRTDRLAAPQNATRIPYFKSHEMSAVALQVATEATRAVLAASIGHSRDGRGI